MVLIPVIETMNYYKRHIGDYAAATRHLSILEHGVYCLLLDMYYTTEGPLPASAKEVCRKLGARSKDEVAAVESVLRDFFTPNDDGWRQSRCDAEIEAYKAKEGKNRVNGTLGGRPKKITQSVSDGNPKITQSVSGNEKSGTLTTNQEPLTINQYQSSSVVFEPPCPNPSGGDDGVEKSENQPRAPWPDGTAPGDAVTWASVFGDEFSVPISTAQPGQWGKFCPLAAAWCAAGVTVGQMRKAVERARLEAVEPIAYLPAYADRVLASMVPRQARPVLEVVPAVDTEGRSAIEAEGVAKGIGRWDELREHWPAYKNRVRGTMPAVAPSLAAIVRQGLKA